MDQQEEPKVRYWLKQTMEHRYVTSLSLTILKPGMVARGCKPILQRLKLQWEGQGREWGCDQTFLQKLQTRKKWSRICMR